MTARIFDAQQMTAQEIGQIAHALDNGAVAIFPTDTVYGIGCGAFCPQAVEKIYTLKQRPATQPLQILVSGWEQAKQVAEFSASAQRLARTFWPGALTLIVPPNDEGRPLLHGAKGLGLRVPAYTTLLKILQNMKNPLCATSANLHGQPVLTEEESLEDFFGAQVDIIIKGGTLSPVASSVVDLMEENNPRLLREGSILQAELEQVLGTVFVRKEL